MKGIGAAVWYGLPPIVVAGAIFWLSNQSAAEVEATGVSGILGTYTGEIVHGLEYLLLGALVFRGLLAWHRQAVGAREPPARLLALGVTAVAISVVYALSDEFHQSFVPGRASEAKDLMIDALGSAIGAMGYALMRRVLGARLGQ